MKARLTAAVILSVPLVAQATHLVGAGGFAQIQDALAIAQLDDTIVVQPGTYLPFTAGVGVRIVAPSGASVVTPAQMGPWLSTTLQPPSGQTVYVSGLAFGQSGSLFPHIVYCQSGQAVFEGCSFSPTHPFKSYYTLQCHHADMVLVRCTFSTFNGAVLVDTGSFAATDCAFYGVDPQSSQTPMPAAVTIRNGRSQLSFCSLRGGDSQNGQPACPGMRVEGISDVALVDCSVTGGDVLGGYGGPPTVGLLNLGANPVRHLRSSFVGGWGSVFTPFGSWRVRGAGTLGPESQNTLLGLVGMTTGLRVGQPYGVVATSVPSTLVVFAVSFGLVAPFSVPQVAQPIRLSPTGSTFAGLGLTDATGVCTLAISNSLPAAALGTPVWVHGLAFDGLLFQSANPVGGLVY